MLTMTEAAGGYLHNVLETSRAPAEAAVRLTVGAEGLSASIDSQRPGDATLYHEGRRVLLLDPPASEALDARTLDVQSTPDGDKLGIS